jgi:hypothetical protein
VGVLCSATPHHRNLPYRVLHQAIPTHHPHLPPPLAFGFGVDLSRYSSTPIRATLHVMFTMEEVRVCRVPSSTDLFMSSPRDS